MPRLRPHSLLHSFWLGIKISILLIVMQMLWCVWLVHSRATQTATQPADAVVVLGAAAWGKNPSPVFRERINHGITLYRRGRAGKLVFTGGTPKAGYMTEAEVGRRYALAKGIPEEDILFESTSRDTVQNLLNTRDLLRRHHLNSIIIVSDPYHLARAAAIADYAGLDYQTEATPTSRYNNQNGQNNQSNMKFMASEVMSLMMFQWWRLGEMLSKF